MADTQLTLFDLPTDPEQISVLLPSAKLRRIDFSALDFDASRRSIFEYIKTYFPEEFNDFAASNGIVMMAEIQAGISAKLALRGDLMANEGFLPTATTELAVRNHLALINQTIRRQTPAVVDVEISLVSALTSDIEIQPGMIFTARGPDNEEISYEVYRSPGDFTSTIPIPAGKRGIIGYGIEGRFASGLVSTSSGGPGQSISISEDSILESPIIVTINTGEEIQEWTATMEPLERYGPTDRVVKFSAFSNRAEFTFGDNINGQAPLAGQEITFRYRVGGGIRGRIGANAINDTRSISPQPPATSPIPVLFRNVSPSSGGTDRESLEAAKKRAPRDFVVRAFASDRPASIVTDGDYAHVASTFAHPVFGSVSKAVATIRTGFNANLIEIYILAEGPVQLVAPSAGLKLALETFYSEFNVFTDSVLVLDGALKAVDVDMTVVINRNADATFIKTKVEEAVDTFFDTTNREMGQPMYRSDLIELISAIDGVAYVDLFAPKDNVLSTKKLAEDDSDGVGINEMIVEGTRDIKFYYEKSRV